MISHNETELIALGKQLGKLIEKQDVIILSGDLGAGKTTFTKGIAKGLGIPRGFLLLFMDIRSRGMFMAI